MAAAKALGIFLLASLVASAVSQNPEWGPAPVHPKDVPAPKAETAAAAAVASGLRRALDWLDRAQRRGRAEEGWGWGWAAGAPGGGDATPLAVLALRLSNDTWLSPDALRSQLAAQQVDMDVLVHLWRHHEAPISPGRLAHYTLALHAICRDPRHFHGHDLVGSLLHHESPSDQEFAIASLAACSSGAHVRKRQIRRLLDVADKAGGSGAGESDVRDAGDVDTLSTVLLALDCIVREHRNRNLEHYVRRPARGLARLQAADGSFGTRTRSTALALQALVATWEEEPSWNHLTPESQSGTSWNRTAALIALLSHQGSDGSFGGGDVVSTAEAALALAGRGGLGAVRNVTCPSPPRPPSPLLPGTAPGFGLLPPPPGAADHTESSRHGSGAHSSAHAMQNDEPFEPAVHLNPITESTAISEPAPTGNVTGSTGEAIVTYTLWVGPNISESLSLTLKAPKNSSFYGVMREAAQQDERFQFSSSTWPNGHYIHTIHGHREQPAAHRYWLLYRLPALPDPTDPPSHHQLSPRGVDDLLVNDGDHFLFWYRKL